MSLSAALSTQTSVVDIGPRAAVHLLNRIGYGPRPGDAARILRQGLTDYIEEQLEAPPDPELDSRLSSLRTLSYPISQIVANYNADQRSVGQVLDDLYAAKIIRAVHGKNQLQEVLVDFWFNHFNVYILDGFARYSTGAYEREAIRPHVLGRFRDLLGATAAHPAMLFYLDNYLSRATVMVRGQLVAGLNENYGRELLELHTVGVDAGYTQEHVFDAARCFTGWTIDFRTSSFVYRQQNHDTAAKQVFGLGVPAGGGKDDGDKLLDYLATHPATARFVARKLAERFVSDDPPGGLVERCARVFLDTGGDLAAVTKSVIGSTEFWSEGFRDGGGKPKTPVEFVFSALRAVDAQATGARGMTAYLQQMGMPLYACLPPTGYSNRGADWLNPSSHLARMNFALDLATGALAGATADLRGVIARAGANPDDARSVAAAMNAEVFARRLSRETLESAGRVAAGGSPSVAARTVGLILASPEMQAR